MLIKKTKIPFKEIVTVGILPSFLKKIIYRLKGYKIGKNVSFSLGSVIIGKNVFIDDNVSFGFTTVVRGKEINIGRYVSIGSMTMIDTEKIIIGEDTRINENVIIGGIKTPDSMISIGKRVIIMEYSFINPTKPIIIGDDTGIGGHCLLFTHGSWLSQLDGFPVTFAPITLGRKVWLPWRVFIMPGVTIGDEVVIGANSLITKSLPSNVLAAGNPAQIIKENYPPKISDEKRDSILASIISDFLEYLSYNGISSSRQDFNNNILIEFSKKNKKHKMLFLKDNNKELLQNHKLDILVCDFEGSSDTIYPSKMILNLKNKTRIGSSDLGEEFAKFISRYGVRFDRLD